MPVRLVLIESDWNLKLTVADSTDPDSFGINRIRLEFKGIFWYLPKIQKYRINRIRLEFKAGLTGACPQHCTSINRIRLEFKDPSGAIWWRDLPLY